MNQTNNKPTTESKEILELEKIISQKDQEIAYWSNKVFILLSKFRQCQKHNQDEDSSNFEKFFKYRVELIECVNCSDEQVKKTNHESN